jgi:hypothetical protein
MLKRNSGARRLPIFRENNNALPINLSGSIFSSNVNPNSAVASPAASPAPSVAMTRSVSPALAARSVRHVTLGTKHTANVRNTAQASHAAAFGKQKLETLRVNRRRSRSRRNTRRNTRRNHRK